MAACCVIFCLPTVFCLPYVQVITPSIQDTVCMLMPYFFGVGGGWLMSSCLTNKSSAQKREKGDTVVKCVDKLRKEILKGKASYDDEERAESIIEK